MLPKFNRKTNNLIASFRGLPRNRSRAFMREEKGLDDVMDKLLDRFKIGTTQPEEIIASQWAYLVGEYNAKHANPWRLDRGKRLYVLVSNPVVKQEMLFRKKMILAQLNKLPGCSEIREIIFRAG